MHSRMDVGTWVVVNGIIVASLVLIGGYCSFLAGRLTLVESTACVIFAGCIFGASIIVERWFYRYDARHAVE